MALGTMKYRSASTDGDVMILYNSEYVGMALTLDTTAFTNGVCKAGSPIKADGTVDNTANVAGILLHDVYEERPQATIVIGGYINTAVAQAHSGVTIAANAKNALKNVVFL